MLQTVISITFFLTFILYAFLGVFCFTLNKNAVLNRTFFFVCLSFAIWAFAFAISNSLVNVENVLNWRRVASLGCGVAFSCILHFILILTDENKLLGNKWVYSAIYFPAAITVFVFGINRNLATVQYNLVHTQSGWGNIPINNLWDSFYNFYYMSFSLLTLLLLLKWYRNSSDYVKRRQAVFLLLSFSLAIVLGTGTEMLANTYLDFKIPSIAPILILIPVITFAYNIKKYGLMAPAESKKTRNARDILSDYTHSTFIRYIAIVYLSVSIFSISQCLFYPAELWSDMIFATIYVIMGLGIYSLTATGLSIINQDCIITVIMAITIPLTLFRFQDNQISNVLWAIPLIYLMMTVIFNYKKMFGIIAAVSIIVGIFSWMMMPEKLINVGRLDYIARLIIYVLAILLAAFINRIYIARIRENDQQIKFQKMLTSITTSFVAVNRESFDEKVTDLLKRSGSFMNADRAYICDFSKNGKIFKYTYRWLAENVETKRNITERDETIAFLWSKEQLLDDKIIYIPNIDSLPPEAESEKEELRSKNIQSIIGVPIRCKDKIIGFIGFDHLSKEKTWQIDEHEKLRVLANILADGIAKVETEKEMNGLAFYDTLTNLPNRVLFQNRLNQALELAKCSEKHLGVLFLDIDGFKEVNDTLGHDWGDYLLKEIGKRLAGCIRKHDTAARFGGDEFLIMLPQIARKEELNELAEKIMDIFRHPVFVKEQEFHITASGGISVYPGDGESANALIKHADLALYTAKNMGKGRVEFCTADMKQEVLEKMTLTNSLYRALERNELFLQYQPQVSVKTHEIMGFEALVGWNHPELGFVSPEVFIPLAEQTGLINSIGEWVLLKACAQSKAWQDNGYKPVQMAVNLSLEQFRNMNIEKIVKNCLDETGLDPKYLELEITEGIAMRESHYIINCLKALKEIGVAISIDDFGTEFSSLSRLKELPVDRLKIDMQFIRGIGVSTKDESIVEVMIYLAKRLGLKVIAEGVETDNQLGFLKKEDCDEIQGYYFYKPLSKDEIENDFVNLFGKIQ